MRKLLAEFVRIISILILGISIGIPVNSLIVFISTIWYGFNGSKIGPARKNMPENIQRKKIELKTGIIYDYFESKEKTKKILCKLPIFDVYNVSIRIDSKITDMIEIIILLKCYYCS